MDPNQAELSADRSSGGEAAWSHVKGLLCRLSVEVPVPHFTVRRLLALAPGNILDTYHEEGAHVPVMVNSQMIAWGDFDVAGDFLAIRLTELVP